MCTCIVAINITNIFLKVTGSPGKFHESAYDFLSEHALYFKYC